jgi:hypothetical protein
VTFYYICDKMEEGETKWRKERQSGGRGDKVEEGETKWRKGRQSGGRRDKVEEGETKWRKGRQSGFGVGTFLLFLTKFLPQPKSGASGKSGLSSFCFPTKVPFYPKVSTVKTPLGAQMVPLYSTSLLFHSHFLHFASQVHEVEVSARHCVATQKSGV